MTFKTNRAPRWSYLTKIALAAALIMLADQWLWNAGTGSVLGGFALIWALATGLSQRALRSNRAALVALGIAVILACVLAIEPSLIGWTLFWSALSMAALLPRSRQVGDLWQWVRRLLFHGLISFLAPIMDKIRVNRVQKRIGKPHLTRHLPALVLPLVGGAVFLALFAMANPIISQALSRVEGPSFTGMSILRMLFWIVALISVWGTLRPRRLRFNFAPLEQSAATAIPGVSVASVILSLITFNLLFALQNGLDLIYLWSGAGLPDQMTLAGYAHRGAYPLILTALLAGLFVLMTTQPGSKMARNPVIRSLVVLWVGQNLFLVASSILRLLDYVEAYSLTILRISALLWMGLVGLGLILITWRMLCRKSIGWLVNSNGIAALSLLAGCSAVDLGGVAASWNGENAREVGGKGVRLDLCYMTTLGSSALLPLIAFEVKLPAGDLRASVGRMRQQILDDVRVQQSNWQSWTWRDARRLAQLPSGLAEIKLPKDRSVGCDGSLYDPTASYTPESDPEAVGFTPPLTQEPKP
jgi:Domain of unknown function (DUF4173)